MIINCDPGDEHVLSSSSAQAMVVSQKGKEITYTPCKTCKFYQEGDTEAHQNLVKMFCDQCPEDTVTEGKLDDWQPVDDIRY